MSETAELHAELVRQFVAALNARDPAALLALVTDDITWHFPGQNRMSGTHVASWQLSDLFGRSGTLTRRLDVARGFAGRHRHDFRDLFAKTA